MMMAMMHKPVMVNVDKVPRVLDLICDMIAGPHLIIPVFIAIIVTVLFGAVPNVDHGRS